MTTQSSAAPTAIPPRRSSTGHNFASSEYASKPALKPVPESSQYTLNTGGSQRRSRDYTSEATSSSLSDPAFPQNRNLLSAYSSKFPIIHPDGTPHLLGADSISKAQNNNADRKGLKPALDLSHHASSITWSDEKEKILLGPYNYMFDHPGKDIRRQLIEAFNMWLQVPEKSLKIITKVVGMLHTASLLIDDVEDSSVLRRGVPVAHSLFGTAQTINSANYVYFAALQELLELRNPTVIKIYTDELCNLHRGQGMDLYWRDSLTCPTEEDYLEMVGNKTGGLFRLAVLLMQAESQSKNDYIPLVNIIGLLFQIRDDYMNLSSPSYTENKGLCEDLTEGKFSFPIIHSIRSNPSNLQLMNILRQKTTDAEVKRYAVNYMEKTGSFEYCRQVLSQLQDSAIRMVDDIDNGRGNGRGVKAILEKMTV